MNVRNPIVIGIIALTAALAAPTLLCAQKPDKVLKIGDTPPAFLLNDLAGHTMRVPEDIRGKVTVIHFWGSWCSFCIQEMKALNSLFRAYRDQGFITVSINSGESKDAVERYVRTVRLAYPILLDPGKRASDRYGVVVIPMTFIIDRKGLIRRKIFGEIDQATLKKLIVPLLPEKQ